MATHSGPKHMENDEAGLDIHDTGLVDLCQRCEEHASHPFSSLDDEMLTYLILAIQEDKLPRSQNETFAMAMVETGINIAKKLFKLYPTIVLPE